MFLPLTTSKRPPRLWTPEGFLRTPIAESVPVRPSYSVSLSTCWAGKARSEVFSVSQNPRQISMAPPKTSSFFLGGGKGGLFRGSMCICSCAIGGGRLWHEGCNFFRLLVCVWSRSHDRLSRQRRAHCRRLWQHAQHPPRFELVGFAHVKLPPTGPEWDSLMGHISEDLRFSRFQATRAWLKLCVGNHFSFESCGVVLVTPTSLSWVFRGRVCYLTSNDKSKPVQFLVRKDAARDVRAGAVLPNDRRNCQQLQQSRAQLEDIATPFVCLQIKEPLPLNHTNLHKRTPMWSVEAPEEQSCLE